MSTREGTTIGLERAVGSVLWLGTTASSLCLGVGLALGLAGIGPTVTRLLLQIGILVLLATPIVRVVVSIAEYFMVRDWTFVTLTTIVLLELATSLVAALVFNRRI